MVFSLARRRYAPTVILLAAAAGTPVLAAPDEPGIRVRSYRVSVEGQAVPLNLEPSFLRTTRWDLTGIDLPLRVEESISPGVNAVHVSRSSLDVNGVRTSLARRALSDLGDLPTTYAGEIALPEETAALDHIGASANIAYTDPGGAVRVEASTIARGWVHTPAGPFVASLRREEVLRDAPGGLALQEVRLRWVSPRIGTVALAHIVDGAQRSLGPAHLPETDRQWVDGLSVLDALPESHLTGARGYYQEFHLPIGVRYSVGWELNTGGDPIIESLVPENLGGPAADDGTMADFIALDVWDLSGDAGTVEKVTTHVDRLASDPALPPNPPDDWESCNQECTQTSGTDECGYCSPRQDYMARVDTDPDNSSGAFDLTNAIFWDDGNDGSGGGPADPSKITVHLLAGTQHEGESDFFGDSGEGGFCNDPDTGRTPVPNNVYSHKDECGYYYEPGDVHASDVYNCEQNIFDKACGVDDALIGDGNNYTAACQSGSENYLGQQLGRVLKAGTVILPSGHTFNTILTRQDVSFCVYSSLSGCEQGGSGLDQVRKFVTLFNVPHLENVVRLDSYGRTSKRPADADSYTFLEETNIGTGLFPPVSVTVTGTTSTSVTLSWDPGTTDFIDRHKIHWGTAPGSMPFNSDDNPGQITGALTVGNTAATVTGLTPGTPYYFTVTSLDVYTNPSTGVVTEYESPIFFTTPTCDPDFDYPDAVGAVPGSGCFPAEETLSLTVTKLGNGDIEYCWDTTAGSCVDGYELLGSNDATSDAGWSAVADPGTNTCITLSAPDKVYYLPVAEGPGGFGPWGHYGH